MLRMKQVSHSEGNVAVKRTKQSAMIERRDKNSSILLKAAAVKNLPVRITMALEAVQVVTGEVHDNEMANVAEVVDEVRDVIMSLLPRLHNAIMKKRCEACMINDPSQRHHICLEAGLVDDRLQVIEECLANCDDTIIRIIYIANAKPVPTVDVESVKAQPFIIEEYQKDSVETRDSEQIVLNFYFKIKQCFASAC